MKRQNAVRDKRGGDGRSRAAERRMSRRGPGMDARAQAMDGASAGGMDAASAERR